MKFSREKPPVWDRLVEAFGASWETTAVTYGVVVHSKRPLIEDLKVHERVHVRQQCEYPGGPWAWWSMYILSKEFRLSQELPAYQAQFRWILENVRDYQFKKRRIETLIDDLSGPLYGGLITKAEAQAAFAMIEREKGE